MRLSYLSVFAFACCLVIGCSDDSKSKANTEQPPTDCQGTDCTDEPANPTPGTPETPDPKDPPEQQVPECGEDIDLMSDAQNCGTCGHACVNAICNEGKCECEPDYFDCDENGTCETLHECACRPGETTPCYEGDEKTKDVGRCKSGYFKCIVDENGAYLDYTECIGQVLPAETISEFTCDADDPELDNDCNGVADTKQDEDEDGFAICKDSAISDCCDNQKWCNNPKPELIHPGVSVDYNDNQIDDNCNGTVDEGEISCSAPTPCEGAECGVEACKFSYGECDQGLVWNNSNDANSALLLAQSMDICMNQSSDPTKGSLLEYSVHRSGYKDKQVTPGQINIPEGMKDKTGNTLIKPRLGHSFALLSTGVAKDVFHGAPSSYVQNSETQLPPGAFFGVSIEDKVPDIYLAAHGNQLQTHPNCTAGTSTSIADSVVLHLKLQAPQDAKGFSFDFRYFTHEYPYYVCSSWNDFFLVLMTDESGKPIGNPDGNIAFDKAGNPISVNNAFFTTCKAPHCSDSQAFGMGGMNACPPSYTAGCQEGVCGKCDSFDELYAFTPTPYVGEGNAMEDANCGGGTAWLTTQVPISGGQVFNLDFYIWDTYDVKKDSSVILDNFRWLCEASSVNTEFAPPSENPIEIN